MAIYVKETGSGQFTRLLGNPTLTSLDGSERAPLLAVKAAGKHAAFGVFEAEPFAVPPGKRITGAESFERDGDTVRQVYVVEDIPPPTADELNRQARSEALERAMTMAAERMVLDEELSDAERLELIGIYPMWVEGDAVSVGDYRRHEGGLYQCVQAHTTQADWTPPVTPALWNKVVAPDVIGAWVQPTGAHDAYAKGALVTHNGQVWVSDIDANVWEPGVTGWSVRP